MVTEYLDIAYIPSEPQNPFHTFDVYVPEGSLHQHDASFPLVCFIHGGAWISEDKSDHADLARRLATSTGYPVAIPNYRLTPRQPTAENYLHHPEHAKDVLQFLEFVRSGHQSLGGPFPRPPTKLFLLGHSCAAHIICSIYLRMGKEKELSPSDDLAKSTAAIMLSEGIYDIDQLLSTFPKYREWFIEQAFGKLDSYQDFSAATASLSPDCRHIRWLIIHSRGDDLVDEGQSRQMYNHLSEMNKERVAQTFGELTDGHDEILQGNLYVDIITKYIKET
ncbi:Alpha/Beta hydrolase protein [Phlebopus sp. FC_14]|nr:Alpha/Beta hydrolase protein [Phlebopus sp. FC_14]